MTRIETTKQRQEAARAFGDPRSSRQTCPESSCLRPPHFNTTSRLAALKEAIQSDPLGRVKEVQKEIDWYLSP